VCGGGAVSSCWEDASLPAVELIWPPFPYRGGFCITDDTDAATLESVRAVYDFLASIGLKATKTVWAFPPVEPCGIPALPPSIQRGITLEDPKYLDYCVGLAAHGFEICLHGASSGNNVRDRTARAFDVVERRFGLPGTYICHAKNAENPYWHEKVAPRGPAQIMLKFASHYRCSGEDPASPYFWGDLCLAKVRHMRLFRTRNVNTLAENPSMPYYDPEKPWVTSWFSATKRSFADATAPAALDQITRECGLCVLYQYMHRYADPSGSGVQAAFRASAERLMTNSAVWVDTTSALMERLRQVQGVVLAHRKHEVWIANAGEADVLELQVRIASTHLGDMSAPGTERAGDGIRIPRLPARRMIRLALAREAGPETPRAVAIDAAGHGRRALRTGVVLVNAGDAPWQAEPGEAVAAGECRFVPAPGMGAQRPIATPSAAELYRLLMGQVAIIGREVAIKGRSLDSRRFLAAEKIALEDHANW
jgi:hypothetical protein